MKLVENAVERRAGVTREQFQSEYLGRNRPIVLTDEVCRWPAHGKWTVEYLLEQFGDRPVNADFHPDTGMHSGHHLVRQRVTIRELLSSAGEDSRQRSLVSHVLTLCPYLIPDYSIPTVVTPEQVESSGFWIKPHDTTSGLHFDHQDGLLAIIQGRKRVLLFHPGQFDRLYPCPLVNLSDTGKRNWSEIFDIFHPDYSRFPKLAEAEYFEVYLDPGDLLFIPKFWWHAVDHHAPMTISLNFFLEPTREDDWPLFYKDRVFIEALLAER